jgi:hypothetical protein
MTSGKKSDFRPRFEVDISQLEVLAYADDNGYYRENREGG